ncbi:hypothetical protein [Deinococcus arcticus]|uniref:Uncharacterized protein n=1 Tax=Deinococcus arcticus TaxID=2136176 RepID=A0A2T3WA20_9DEIO|nr:hypothetical protein [Deinococcus arcticus]PTA68603.1 hypothetical protein C8263_07375 [Deinococcus arcticus]
MDDLAYYDLERYLFETVSVRFAADEEISTFDFFCIVVWKANRAKSRVAARLMKRNPELDLAVQQLVTEVRSAENAAARLKVLMVDWGFRLPMASAILTVFYPDEFTIYDVRACEQLGNHHKLADIWDFGRLWEGYQGFVAAVQAAVPDHLSLRDKDRVLWARSFRQQLEADTKRRFGVGAEL